MTSPLSIIVPIHVNSAAALDFANHVKELAAELRAEQAVLEIVSRSSDPLPTPEWLREVQQTVPTEYLVSSATYTTSEAINRGIEKARIRGAHALIIDPLIKLAPGSIREMLHVLNSDPMIGFVTSRQNNSSNPNRKVIQLPNVDEVRDIPYSQALAEFQALSQLLPRFSFLPYAPTGSLLIRNKIVREFGGLRNEYPGADSSIADLSIRANRCGYRVAVANRSFAYYPLAPWPDDDLTKSMSESGKRFRDTAKEYIAALNDYMSGPDFRYERFISSRRINSDKPTLAIDMTRVHRVFNGTYQCMKSLLTYFHDAGDFNLAFVCPPEAARLHKLAEEFPKAEIHSAEENRTYDLAMLLGQPFLFGDMTRLSRLAPYNFYLMLDVIAWDCLYLRNGHAGLDGLWKIVAEHSDGVLFISKLSQMLFNNRFQAQEQVPQWAELLSVKAKDYDTFSEAAGVDKSLASPVKKIFVVGNQHYYHKGIDPAVELLATNFPDAVINVLGLGHSAYPNVRAYESGRQSERIVEELYSTADVIVFPSHYEGFGFPIVQGLAKGKSMIVRNTILNHDISSSWSGPGELLMFDTMEEIVPMVSSILAQRPWQETNRVDIENATDATDEWGWTEIGKSISKFLLDALSADPNATRCRKRLHHLYQIEAVPAVASLRGQKSCVPLSQMDEVLQEFELRDSLLRARHAEVEECNRIISTLQGVIAHKDQLIQNLLQSASFRFGKKVTGLVKRIPGARQIYGRPGDDILQ